MGQTMYKFDLEHDIYGSNALFQIQYNFNATLSNTMDTAFCPNCLQHISIIPI